MRSEMKMRILDRAIKDLKHEDDEIRFAAVEFWVNNHHRKFADGITMPEEELKQEVIDIMRESGVRRKKLVGQLVARLQATSCTTS